MDPPASYLRFLGRSPVPGSQRKDRYWLHGLLLAITFISTAFTTSVVFIGRSAAWATSDLLFSMGGLPITTAMVWDGCLFAMCLLLFLTAHEFGHYFTARWHQVHTSLPYYIPTPLIGIGTMGAVISIREPVPSSRKIFDIGVAGPLAGFVVALPLLLYAMAAVPPPEYMFGVGGHEALLAYIGEHGTFPPEPLERSNGTRLTIGATPLYWGLGQLMTNLPPMYEMYHYPILFAAWLALFFTALNLMPVGQLDGGHIVYALAGPHWHLRISRAFVIILLTSMAIGAAHDFPAFMSSVLPSGMGESALLRELCTWLLLAMLLRLFLRRIFSKERRWVLVTAGAILAVAALGRLTGEFMAGVGYTGWLLWCFLLVFLIKVKHPPVAKQHVLTRRRRVLGIAAMIIFVLCFSFKPIYFV